MYYKSVYVAISDIRKAWSIIIHTSCNIMLAAILSGNSMHEALSGIIVFVVEVRLKDTYGWKEILEKCIKDMYEYPDTYSHMAEKELKVYKSMVGYDYISIWMGR